MPALSPVMASLASAFQIPLCAIRRRPAAPTVASICRTTQPRIPIPTPLLRSSSVSRSATATATASFSTTSAQLARKKGARRPDRRISVIRYHLHHPTTLTPRPLRFSRTRFLRHWTIHRAWQLFRHQQNRSRERELERQWNAMRDACEELRLGVGDGGRLFRKAMLKTGTWRHGGVPIEYSRGMMDWVGTFGNGVGGKGGRVWDEGWKR